MEIFFGIVILLLFGAFVMMFLDHGDDEDGNGY